MIFYYTGTGNSYAAAAAAEDCCRLTDIMECHEKGTVRFSVPQDEALGFFLPVAGCGLPKLVRDWMGNLSFNGKPSYVYLVLTYSNHYGNAAVQSAELLSRAGLGLDAFYTLPMPENNVIDHVIPSDEERDAVYEKAETQLKDIASRIAAKERTGVFAEPGFPGAEERYASYLAMCRTDRFTVDDRCVSCGICATRCPYHSIELIDGVPTWTGDLCTLCMGCMRCGAVHYGNTTVGKKRYTHPFLKKNGKGHAAHARS